MNHVKDLRVIQTFFSISFFVPTFDFDQMGSLIHLHFTFLQHSAITVLENENMNMIR